MHESNGLDIIISLVLNDIKPLADTHMELALDIKVKRDWAELHTSVEENLFSLSTAVVDFSRVVACNYFLHVENRATQIPSHS